MLLGLASIMSVIYIIGKENTKLTDVDYEDIQIRDYIAQSYNCLDDDVEKEINLINYRKRSSNTYEMDYSGNYTLFEDETVIN